MEDIDRKWVRKVGIVFRSQPRNGNQKGIVWLPRVPIEREIQKLIETPGINICIDGPTGTGKSSLAITSLNKLGLAFDQIQITQNMDWKNFCKKLIADSQNKETSISTHILAGIQSGLPTASVQVNVESKGRESDLFDFWEKILSRCDEGEIAEAISNKGLILIIDDFEKANDELVIRIADMCKLLTQSYDTDHGKVIIIGTGNIFSKLYDADPALEERLYQFSLGTLPTPEWAWKYLLLGFEALGMYHPANSKYSKEGDVKQCLDEVYKAADGLLKKLTALGRDICYQVGPPYRAVSPKSIIDVAKEIPPKNYKQFRRKFPVIFKCIEENPVVRGVLLYLYDSNIGQIHNWDDISFDLSNKFDQTQIDNAIAELVKVDFLVRTGKDGETLFVNEPVLAHTLGVVISNPEEFRLPQQYIKLIDNYKIPFFNRNNT